MNYNIFVVCVLFTFWNICSGHIEGPQTLEVFPQGWLRFLVELQGLCVVRKNVLSQFPPLYELQSWSQCQRPEDVYCLVDAALKSDGDNATIIHIIQNYSKDTIRHYNRSVIHRGVCVTRCEHYDRQNGSWIPLQRCIGESLHIEYGLQVEILSVGWCSDEVYPPVRDQERAFLIFCVILLGVALISTAAHIFGEKYAKWEGNKYLLAFSIKNNWSILTYDRSRPKTEDRMADIACMEGIRFMAMQCVIFSHVVFIFIYSYTDNPEYVENMYEATGWRIMLNSPLWVQSFFSLSGFLTAYMTLIYVEKHRFTWMTFVSGILNRWIRLTPTALFALWFTMSWFPRISSSGPLTGWMVSREAADCSDRWWHHIFYYHNHLPLGKFCMGHTWYLAADMQLHIFGLAVLAVCCRWRRLVWPVLGALLAASALSPALVAFYNDLQPIITIQAPESVRNLFAGNAVLSLLYLPSYMNGAGYVCGLATAFALYSFQQQAVKLNQNKIFTSAFHLSILAGSIVVSAGILFLHSPPPGLISAVTYIALDRTLVAICFNVFLLGCFSHCKSLIVSGLSWCGLHPLGRLSYCAFLLHFIVLRLMVAGNTQLAHASVLTAISLLITASTLTYIVSVPVCLLVELPAVQLWRAAVDGGEKSRPAQPSNPTCPQQHFSSPCDLLSQLRRNI